MTLDIAQVKLFHLNLSEISNDGELWTSFIEVLNPLLYGAGVLVMITAAIFFTQKVVDLEKE